ncbi:MAG: hypothetical protein JWQ54_4513 [Mucilaginibacter sp.]|nr:hypothetical protein [Mucilaginibacter sp.]
MMIVFLVHPISRRPSPALMDVVLSFEYYGFPNTIAPLVARIAHYFTVRCWSFGFILYKILKQ